MGVNKFRIREITDATGKTIFVAEKWVKYLFWYYWKEIWLIDEYRTRTGWWPRSKFDTKKEAEQQIEQFKEFIRQNELENQTIEIIHEY